MRVNHHAKEMSKLGASRGGQARAKSLTKEQRSNIARKAVLARWSKEKGLNLPLPTKFIGDYLLKATHTGILQVKNVEIPCYVLENGERVISGRGLQNAFGYTSNSSGQALSREIEKFDNRPINEAIVDRVEFKRPGAGGAAEKTFGYKAEVLVDICDFLLEYRKGHALTPLQERLAHQAEILTRAFAKVGVIALIDEATGYKKAKDEYQKILEQYLAPELQPWIKTFDDEYYQQLYRLLGWDWNSFKKNKKTHSQYIGKLTNRIVYEKLAPGILETLNVLNPKNEKGHRSHRFHQELSRNIGYIKLIKHLSAITTIMEQFDDGHLVEALHKIDSRYPSLKLDFQLGLDFPIPMGHKD